MLQRRLKKQSKKNRGYKYSGKPYSNPFFNRKRRGMPGRPYYDFSRALKIFLFLFVVSLFLLVYLFFFSDYFKIKNTEISGEGGIDNGVIENAISEQTNSNRYAVFPQKNIFIFNKDELSSRLKNKYSFDFLNIKKDLPNKIIIEYREKEYSIIWTEDEKYYYIDKEGYVISETNVLEIGEKNYPLVENKNSSRIYEKKVPTDQNYINCIIDIYNKFKALNEFKIEKFITDAGSNTVKIKIINGPYVLFNANESIEKQISKLQIIKNEKKDNFFKKEYIDVRYGDSVYIR